MKMTRLLTAAFAACLFLSLPAMAEKPPVNLPVLEDIAEVRAAETYLDGVRTLQARFIQTDNAGTQAAGDFWLKRPGRMRFEYDDPVTDFIVADGKFVYYYDGQMKQQSSTLIGRSLADFFLREKFTLSGDVKVTDVRREGGLLQITVVQAEDPGSGSLTLGLTEKPLALKKWRILDSQGMITEVELFDVQTGQKIDSDRFHYYDPEQKVPGYN